ncbi:MAG TPA: iron ABC transporter permease [Gemmataceae bacterium]|nr:iron ABC transporter permease [Gemmataceae bacterium]
MHWRTLPVELLLLAFLAVFLLYPLGYVIPGAASDEDYEVRLLSLGKSAAAQAKVSAVLAQANPGQPSEAVALRLPYTVRTFPDSRPADGLRDQLRAAGAEAEVVHHRHWTGFYFREALGFRVEAAARLPYFRLVPNSPFLWDCLRNSLTLAVLTTLATTLLCLPLALWFTRYRFTGQGLLSGLLLVPLILPPFVGAIGLERFLNRFGTLNLWLMDLGIVDPGRPIDWLGEGGFGGVVIMQVLHLYPVLYLSLAAAWANVDPALEDAARNLGASEVRVFRTVTFPLLLPGYFAGATLVFVWAFTDLGTPLVLNLHAVIPVQIFEQVSDPRRTNSVAYALVVITLAVTAVLFYAARWLVGRRTYVSGGKGATATAAPQAGRGRTLLIYGSVLGLTALAVLPTVGMVLTAVARRWVFTPLPESYTTAYLGEVWSNRVSALSIRNSLYYSAASTLLDIVLGVTLAWLVARRPSWLTGVLDGLATLPLALPGLVLAFGYLTCYSNWNLGPWDAYLDPVRNPVPLLVIAYTVRRLPYLTRSASAGLQQIPPVLEEAAENLGASRWRVLRTVTLPLVAAQILGGAVLTFAFAVLEVSDSLMLAREEKFYPITRAIVGLLMQPEEGDNLASALAVFAMGFLVVGLLAAGLALGRKMGELFRA